MSVVWSYTVAPGAPRSGQVTLRQGSGGARTLVFASGVLTGSENELATAVVDRFLVDGITTGSVALEVNGNAAAAWRIFDYAIVAGVSPRSGRIDWPQDENWLRSAASAPAAGRCSIRPRSLGSSSGCATGSAER